MVLAPTFPVTPPLLLEPPHGWLRRFGFRLLLLYMMLLSLPGLPGLVPGFGWLSKGYHEFWQLVVPWVGREIMHLYAPVVFRPTGSGDTLFQWVGAWCGLVLAFSGALVWVWCDRRRKYDAWIHEGVRIAMRYTLGATLVVYGISKVLHQQMPFPNGDRLIQTYGDSSPMGLVWTFMGYSQAYSMFAGLAEVLGGVLLFFRRTTLVGSLLLAGVMLNVVMMNFCFDVPVKIFSTQLLISAVFLSWPAWARLAGVLFSNRTVSPAPVLAFAPPRGVRIALLVAKLLLVGWILYSRAMPQWEGLKKRQEATAKTNSLVGLYEVRGHTSDGVEQSLLATEAKQWRYVSVNAYNVMIVRRMDRGVVYYTMTPIPGKPDSFHVIAKRGAKADMITFTRPTPNELVVEGSLERVAVTVRLRRMDEKDFLLVKRGFHWVNEYPFNR